MHAPSGEAARAVFREYDVPVDPEIGDDKVITGDGSDWSRGTPARRGSIVHDAWMDLDGNIWANSNAPNRKLTIARVDTKTGAYKPFVVPGRGGFAGNSHGMWRDKAGLIWFNVNTGAAGSPGSIRAPRRSTSTCRRRACRRPAAPPPSTSTARASSG